MTTLTIRADELIMAFEDHGSELQHFLDTQTGDVLTVFRDMDAEYRERLDDDPDRYLQIEPLPSRVGYEIMVDFVDAMPEGKIARELGRALRQKHLFTGSKTFCGIIRRLKRTGFASTNRPS